MPTPESSSDFLAHCVEKDTEAKFQTLQKKSGMTEHTQAVGLEADPMCLPSSSTYKRNCACVYLSVFLPICEL